MGAVEILRKHGGNAAASATARASVPPRCKIEGVQVARRLTSESLLAPPPTPKKQPVAVISDSDGGYGDDTDCEIEATYPTKPIKRSIDCFELIIDDKSGGVNLRKTCDATTGTYLDAPTTGRESPTPAA